MLDFTLGVDDRRRDVLNDHVGEALEFAEEPSADETKQWTNVEFQLGLGQSNAELVENAGKGRVNIADHLRRTHSSQGESSIERVSIALT